MQTRLEEAQQRWQSYTRSLQTVAQFLEAEVPKWWAERAAAPLVAGAQLRNEAGLTAVRVAFVQETTATSGVLLCSARVSTYSACARVRLPADAPVSPRGHRARAPRLRCASRAVRRGGRSARGAGRAGRRRATGGARKTRASTVRAAVAKGTPTSRLHVGRPLNTTTRSFLKLLES